MTRPDDSRSDEESVWMQLTNRPFVYFFLVLGATSLASLSVASNVESLITPKYDWIRNYLLLIALILALVTAVFFGFFRFLVKSRSLLLWVLPTVTTLVALAFILLFLGLSPFVRQPPQATPGPDSTRITAVETQIGEIRYSIDSLYRDLRSSGLVAQDADRVQGQIETLGYVTLEFVDRMGLNPVMRQEIIDILASSGYLRDEDVNVKLTQVANEALVADIMTRESTCFITPLPAYNRVYIRESPELLDSNTIGLLDHTAQLRVIGHNGGTMNINRWWLVVLPNDAHGTESYGWVASNVVEEIHQSSCVELPQYPSP